MKQFTKYLALAAIAVLASTSTWAGNITIKGSDTLVILAQKWAEIYMGDHKDVKIQVSGGGSGIGFAALQNQTTDLVAMRRARSRRRKFKIARKCSTPARA